MSEETIVFNEDDLEIINTVFPEKNKQELLNQINEFRKYDAMVKGRAQLLKILSEKIDVTNIAEIDGTPYNIKPLKYTYKNDTILEVHFRSLDEIILKKGFRTSFKSVPLPACLSYRYVANNMTDIINALDKIHNAIDEGVI